MEFEEPPRTIPFPVEDHGAGCNVCGLPRQSEAICQHCAFHLLNLALEIDAEEAPATPEKTANQDSSSRLPSLRYGHYEVCRSNDGEPWELGRGAMGITYKATDTHLGRHAALKVISQRFLDGAGARDRFLREARTVAQLRHPNIASVFHLGPDAESCFYAMEFVEGETLEARIRRQGALPLRLALDIVLQAAHALKAAHAKQFVHRDIKPANIMLAESGHSSKQEIVVKLIDFGLVKTTTDDEPRGNWCGGYFAGTPYFASPEQLDEGTVDVRSDIYSLGRCLEYMLCGHYHKEFAGGSSLPTPKTELEAPAPDPASQIPGPAAGLLASMTARTPASRLQNAEEIIARTSDCLAALDGKRRWGRIFGGLLSLAIICLLGTAWYSARIYASTKSYGLLTQGKERFREYTQAGNRAAENFYLQAIAFSPSNAEAHAELASIYYDDVARFGAPASRLEQAIASAQRAITLDPNLPDGYQVLAAIRNLQGQPWEALQQLHRCLELNPQSSRAMSDFGLLWTCVGHPEKALPWARAAAQLEPSKIQGWHAAAEVSAELCADQQAEEFYRRCLALKPMWMSGHCGLIHLHLLQGNFVRARQDLAEANSIPTGSIFPLTLKAQVDLFSGEYVDAEATYRQLLAQKRQGYVRYYGSISYLSALGLLRLQVSDYLEGNALLAEAEKLHSADSEGPEDAYDLAAIRAVQGRREDAMALLRQAISSGWNDYRSLSLDPRFGCLRNEVRFQQMLADLSQHVAAMRVEAEELCHKALTLADYPVNPSVRTGGK